MNPTSGGKHHPKKTERRNGRGRSGKKNSHKVQVGTRWVSKIPGQVFPDSIISKLTFFTSPILTQNGFTTANNRWKLNSAYDVDPTLGSAAVAGFLEAANVYCNYRVLHSTFNVDFQNQEAFPATIYLTFAGSTLGDPGANNSGAIDWMMNPYTKRQLCSAAGGMDRGSFRESIDLAKLSGSSSYMTDDNFASLATTSPATILYAIIGIDSTGSSNFTTGKGFGMAISYTFTVQFYGRKLLQT